jgi:hypothetical protein
MLSDGDDLRRLSLFGPGEVVGDHSTESERTVGVVHDGATLLELPAQARISLADPERPLAYSLALLGRSCEELRGLVLNGFAATLRATQMRGLMLGNVFDMLESLAALCATVSVCRHGASPTVTPSRPSPRPAPSVETRIL